MSRPHDERPGRHRPGRAVPGPRPGGAPPPADRRNGRHATRRAAGGPETPEIPDPRPEQALRRERPAHPPAGPRPLPGPDADVPTTGVRPVPPVPSPRPRPAGEPEGPRADPGAGPVRPRTGEDDTRTGRIPSPTRRRAPVRPPVHRTFGVRNPTTGPAPDTTDLDAIGFDTNRLEVAPLFATPLDEARLEAARLEAARPDTARPDTAPFAPGRHLVPPQRTSPVEPPRQDGTAALAGPSAVPVETPITPARDHGVPARAGATVVAPQPVPAPRRAAPPPPDEPAAPSSTRPDRGRLLGVDVARGVALFGIIAVHALVEGNDDGAPATNYLIFGGRSAALFALLAGVALAFMTGRARVRRDSAAPVAAMIATRAAVLLVLGLALGWTDPEIAAVILPYYAVMFLLAIPLLFLPTGVLAGLTVVLAGAVPVLSHLVRPSLPVPTLDNPHLLDLVTGPLDLLSELAVTGAYPAVPWLAYLGAGIVVGRLRLSSLRTAVALFAGGAAAAGAATAVSWWLLTRAGGYDAIIAATPLEQLESAPTVVDFVNGLPDGVTPTTTWWWLATIAPHSGTPLDLVQTIGSALAVLGAALLLAGVARPLPERLLGYVLRPVAAAGSMTLTLYTASLLFMNSPLDVFGALEGYLWQIGAALVIGTAWRRAVGRGPLEAATSMIAHAARDRVRAHRRVDRGRRPARRGARSSRSR